MEEYQDIKELLKPQRTIGASTQLRQRVGEALAKKHNTGRKTKWLWSGAAAACVAMILGTITLSNDNSDCIVYVAGKQASADEAQAIAEADVAKMELFMHTVAQRNAAEEEKVNQFMHHKSLQQ